MKKNSSLKGRAIVVLFAVVLFIAMADKKNAQIGQRVPSEMFSYTDSITGVPVKVFTNHAEYSDTRLYPTHPH